MRFSACESDARKVNSKFSADFLKRKPTDGHERGGINSSILINENATYENIRDVFLSVARSASAEDHLVVFFAGLTDMNNDEAIIVPYFTEEEDSSDYPMIKVGQLASWMENISAKNQLIITEAGNGEDFAMGLISELFERNPVIASEFIRNRLILTTKGLGGRRKSV